MNRFEVRVYSVGGGDCPTWYCVVDGSGKPITIDGGLLLFDEIRDAKLKANNLNAGIETLCDGPKNS